MSGTAEQDDKALSSYQQKLAQPITTPQLGQLHVTR